MTTQQQTAWSRFLQDTGRSADTPCYECFYFCDNESAANELLALVLAGTKTATTSYRPSYVAQDQPLPEIGTLSMVTDFAGTPRCVIETKAVTCLPFDQMTFDICKREGEDTCLETWQSNHRRFFGQECQQVGIPFDEHEDVVFEDFEVIFRF